MSGNARDFNDIETRAVTKFSFLQGKAPKEIYAILKETLWEYAPSYATVKNWVARLKRGDFSTCAAPCSGRHKRVTTPEIIDKIHEIILEDRRISAKSIAEQPGISREWVGSIIHDDLEMRKLSAKWVLKCLNVDQKRQQCQTSEQILEFFWRNPNDFLSRLVTMDETWLYHYEPETKQQSMEWRHSGSPRPKENPSAKIRSKSSRLDFLGFKTASSSLIVFQGPNYRRGVLIISVCVIEGHFEGKTSRKGPQGWSCSCTTMPRFTVHLQPRRN